MSAAALAGSPRAGASSSAAEIDALVVSQTACPSPIYEAPLRPVPGFRGLDTDPVTLPWGLLHRQAVSAVRDAVPASMAEADAILADYFSVEKRTSRPDVIATKMRHLIYFATEQGSSVRRKIELVLAPHMGESLWRRVVGDVKHTLYQRCTRGRWNAETLAEVEHLLQLHAARPEYGRRASTRRPGSCSASSGYGTTAMSLASMLC